jgi:hypothetical protein
MLVQAGRHIDEDDKGTKNLGELYQSFLILEYLLQFRGYAWIQTKALEII